MKKELEYYYIGKSLGGNQNWLRDPIMRLGGCGAVTACEFSIYQAIQDPKNQNWIPFDPGQITKDAFMEFTKIMKPYLKPRFQGINKLSIYIDGFTRYLKDQGLEQITVEGFSGDNSLEEAIKVIKTQLDRGFPIPYLLLRHKSKAIDFFTWHWFILAGYEEFEKDMYVKVITYGRDYWLSLKELWDTGYENKGGLILIQES